MSKSVFKIVVSFLVIGFGLRWFGSLLQSGPKDRLYIDAYFVDAEPSYVSAYTSVKYPVDDINIKIRQSTFNDADIIITVNDELAQQYASEGYIIQVVGTVPYVAKFDSNISSGYKSGNFESIGTSSSYYTRTDFKRVIEVLNEATPSTGGAFSSDKAGIRIVKCEDLGMSNTERSVAMYIPAPNSEYRRDVVDILLYSLIDGREPKEISDAELTEIANKVSVVLQSSYESVDIRSALGNNNKKLLIVPEIQLGDSTNRQYLKYTISKNIYVCSKQTEITDGKNSVSITDLANALSSSKKVSTDNNIHNDYRGERTQWCQEPPIVPYIIDFETIFGKNYWEGTELTVKSAYRYGGTTDDSAHDN